MNNNYNAGCRLLSKHFPLTNNIISTLYVILLLLNDLLLFNTGDDDITVISNADIVKFLDRSENIRR